MAKTSTQRSQDYTERKRADGYYRMYVWVWNDDTAKERIKKYVKRVNKEYEKPL